MVAAQLRLDGVRVPWPQPPSRAADGSHPPPGGAAGEKGLGWCFTGGAQPLRSRGSGGAGWKGNLGAAVRLRSAWPEFFAKRIRSYAPTVNELSFAGDGVSALPTTGFPERCQPRAPG